ncbi:hypothetical protein ADK67_31830 [Saccharothrix sp. NRRL B-16348]|nr:hypothetical protein ADK67_31830 [Saccharothrix sp. NRRL B-16348]
MVTADRIDAELIEDARAVLDDIVSWKLVPPRWDVVAAFLRNLLAALDTDDAEGFRDAVLELELTGPARYTRVGHAEATVTSARDDVLELVGAVVDGLDVDRSLSEDTAEGHD